MQQDRFVMELPLLRHYLRNASPRNGAEVLVDAFRGLEVGALTLVKFYLMLRGNRRTRRSMQTVAWEWRRLTRSPNARKPSWYKAMLKHLIGLFRQWRVCAYPVLARSDDRALTEGLPRAVRRVLGYTGAVVVELPTLKVQAAEVASQLWSDLADGDVVVWVDNWYAERFTTNPDNAVLSVNVTAFAVLVLSTVELREQAVQTRTRTLPPFPGHLTLHHMTIRVEAVKVNVVHSLQKLQRAAAALCQQSIMSTWVRVPLDENRPVRPTLPWRPLTLSDNRVSENMELLHVVQDLLAVQAHTRGVMPVLVDEKIHYTLLRMMHSRLFEGHDMLLWLHKVPLIYGVWHPYKQAVHLVYRQFFPIFGLLETTGVVQPGQLATCHRKLLYMEKMVLSVLLCSKTLLPEVHQRLQTQLVPPGY